MGSKSRERELSAHKMLTRKWRETDLQGHYMRIT